MNIIYPHAELVAHQQALRQCTRCPDMIRPVITGEPVFSPVMSIGQAPGIHEAKVLRPFGWTAGKTLFKWFEGIGLNEENFRKRVYMSAVCRCFPGKNPKGGDRMPSQVEVTNCTYWLQTEIRICQPQLIILIGKLAINQFLPDARKLDEVVGQAHRVMLAGRKTDLVPLPHPSGLSTWPRMEPGKTLLRDAMQVIAEHPAWRSILQVKTDDW
ncbi:MAG TPA: uracil-DNA glycosylase family protein [Candidatus Thiothrix moscowensis]|uniref:uracil-DNA glycosylase family protein n=1 Tax=unclassified Thiothrix TaxID=2636184 RepID=UPI0025D65CDA|nr:MULTISPECIES: uracil-DNA glycosylase family protein [unclassified Thiothrix]HRJ52565.1 uracil-DNA glycosylase family protein [Candidatus Thiothrix moscowensis]HRJ94291.1 uracil-DNA glycosylase family protein [Candidatus Thiothrix moscowensis]